MTKTSYYQQLQHQKKKSLLKKIYPTQRNPCYFLRVPKTNKLVSIDYLLRNIIIVLWKNGITTIGCDMGGSNRFINGFITFQCHDKAVNILAKLFGAENLRINQPHYDGLQGLIIPDNKIYFCHYAENGGNPFMKISFNHRSIPWIHEKLNIRIPKNPGANPIMSDEDIEIFFSAK